MAIAVPGLADSRPTDLTTFTVRVDGAELPGTYGVVALDIAREVNRIPTASLVLHDGDPAAQEFEISSGDLLVPGQEIEIEGGYGGDVTRLFKGVVTRQRIEVRRRGGSRLRVDAKDAAFRMTLDRKSRYFADLTDSDLFEEIIRQYDGLTAEVEPTTTSHPEIVQYRASDWDFIVSRAERLGMVCTAADGKLQIGKPSTVGSPALSLAYGTGIFDVDLVLDARDQHGSVTASAWDPANQELASSETEDVDAPAQGNLSGSDLSDVGSVDVYALRHTGRVAQEELDAWARAEMVKARFSRIRGTVRVQGTEAVEPGGLVELDGLGDRFNGTAWVSGVRHALGAGDWETTIQIGLDPDWHHERYPISAPPAAGRSPAVGGLQIGVVTQIHEDPAGEERVQVRIPVIGPEDQGTWARLATLDAGPDRGTVFRPEVDDEVVIGFLDDDPHDPVVLGMLHSSAKAAPIPAAQENDEKGLVTRSGMKLLFNDSDDGRAALIETPNGNKLLISDGEALIRLEDESGNKITMSADGITLESAADVIIKAPRGDVKIDGVNVQAKASAAFKGEGSSGAKLSSGGSTEISGSLVQIN